jgi:hypothetical protein
VKYETVVDLVSLVLSLELASYVNLVSFCVMELAFSDDDFSESLLLTFELYEVAVPLVSSEVLSLTSSSSSSSSSLLPSY